MVDDVTISVYLKVMDQKGTERSELHKPIMDARSQMCDIANGENGLIERWNKLMKDMGIVEHELYDDLVDSYANVTNAIWTTKLHDAGYKSVKIIDEHWVPVNTPTGNAYTVIIKINDSAL